MVVSNPEVVFPGIVKVLLNRQLEDVNADLGGEIDVEGTLALLVPHPVGDTIFNFGAHIRSPEAKGERRGPRDCDIPCSLESGRR